MENLNLIKRNHEKIGRKYPRPNINCPDCDEKVILCWGNKIKNPYIRHKTKSDCQEGESLVHLLAKNLLCDYLNNKGKLKIIRNCFCGFGIEVRINTDLFFETEKRIQNEEKLIIFDIMGSNEEELIGIEILYKHKTEENTLRDNYIWYEVETIEVLNKLDLDEVPKKIKLNCKREKVACGIKICLSNKEIAEILDYYHFEEEKYITKSRKLIDCAILGKYKKGYKIWESRMEEPNWDDDIWDEFLERNSCIRCCKLHKTQKGKPFCKKCYKLAAYDDEDEGEYVWKEISDYKKRKLRREFSWLNDISGDWESKSPCHFCGTRYLDVQKMDHEDYNKFGKYTELLFYSSGIDGYVWWFGDKKRCCTICLEEKYLEKSNILCEDK